MHLFIPNSIHSDTPTKLLKHFISRTFTFLLLALSYPMPLLRTTPLVQLLFYIDTSWSFSPILYCSAHFSALPGSIPLIHSPYHIPFTSSISCHLRSQVLITTGMECFHLIFKSEKLYLFNY